MDRARLLDYETGINSNISDDYTNIIRQSFQVINVFLQDRDESGTLILVSSDGTQQPPIQFPAGGHLVQVYAGCS